MKMKVEELIRKIEIPQDVEVKIENTKISVKGPKGEITRDFKIKRFEFVKDNNELIIKVKKATKREKRLINTFAAHIRNMFKGVTQGFIYKMKVCYSHFPINVSLKGNELIIKNFLGEKYPRTVKLPKEVNVKINGDIIVLEGIDKEKVGNCATLIEQATRITNRDRRVFQDGIYLIEKDGKSIV